MINFWKPSWLFQPKNSGWYLCTVVHGNGLNKPRVMELYFDAITNKWINRHRQLVFDGYNVYESCRAPIDSNRVYFDSDCERIDVVAWRKKPRIYRWWKH